MFESAAIEVFEKTGALQKGHFRLISGQHSSRYFQCIRVFAYPDQAATLFSSLAERFAHDKVEIVLGINPAGTIMAYEVASRLGARLAIAQNSNDKFSLVRGFTFTRKDRVLVVDDVTTTGGTLVRLIDLVLQEGAGVIGVGLIATKGLAHLDLGRKTEILVRLEGMDAFDGQNCPLCKQGIPFTN